MRLTTLMTFAVAFTAIVVGVGVAATGDPDSGAELDTPLAEIDLRGLTPQRALFCDQISAHDIVDAVGPEPTGTAWYPGEESELEPGLSGVPHEYGCSYTAGDAVARAWIFGSPITVAQAQALVTEATADPVCAPAGQMRFADPGAVLSCTSVAGRSLRALGRIGDSWVRCELTLAPDDTTPGLAERGQRWCIAAVNAMTATAPPAAE